MNPTAMGKEDAGKIGRQPGAQEEWSNGKVEEGSSLAFLNKIILDFVLSEIITCFALVKWETVWTNIQSQ